MKIDNPTTSVKIISKRSNQLDTLIIPHLLKIILSENAGVN